MKTDSTHTKAAVPMDTPAAEIAEITLIALCDFFEKRYRLATQMANWWFGFLFDILKIQTAGLLIINQKKHFLLDVFSKIDNL